MLADLDIEATDGSGCSFYHCGVDLPLSHVDAERYRAELEATEAARGDPHGFARRDAPGVMTIYSDGTFTTDYEALARLEAQAGEDGTPER